MGTGRLLLSHGVLGALIDEVLGQWELPTTDRRLPPAHEGLSGGQSPCPLL
jgi:hypothetical protein